MRRSPYTLPDFLRFRKVPLLGSALGAALGSKHNLEVSFLLSDLVLRHLGSFMCEIMIYEVGSCFKALPWPASSTGTTDAEQPLQYLMAYYRVHCRLRQCACTSVQDSINIVLLGHFQLRTSGIPAGVPAPGRPHARPPPDEQV